MIASFPPETMSPSGCVADGCMYARELMNALPCEAMVSEYVGG